MLRFYNIFLASTITCHALITSPHSLKTRSFLPTSNEENLTNVKISSKDKENFISSSEDEAIERTKLQLEILRGAVTTSRYDENEENEEKETLYQRLIKRPANSLKEELTKLKLPSKGRKPDLARRLVDHYLSDNHHDEQVSSNEDEPFEVHQETKQEDPIQSFGSMTLSNAAGQTLANAGFRTPTRIQAMALPILTEKEESIIIHSETGSGKTIAYLLPITEKLWKEMGANSQTNQSFALILTPTRELAVQVAGVATALSPPNTVRLITTPSNLVRPTFEEREKSEAIHGGRQDITDLNEIGTKLIIGSAKSIMASLFGDGKMPTSPTSKPEAKMFLKNVEYLVMDEVDRLLDVKKSRGKTSKFYKKHEKPAASIASSISRLSLGKVQVVAASATVGRPLRRELSRVLGLTPDECPQTLRADNTDGHDTNRAISLPTTLKHFVVPCDAETSGGLLTTAAFIVKEISNKDNFDKRILFVVTQDCGIQLNDAMGALRHFGVSPEPKLLLDFMNTDGTDNLIEAYRLISDTAGVGERSLLQRSPSLENEREYLLMTGENSVRGIHLNDLDIVIVVGRTKGPDEYIHVAGRAGRAGKAGKVINIVSLEQLSTLTNLESMLGINFSHLDQGSIDQLN